MYLSTSLMPIPLENIALPHFTELVRILKCYSSNCVYIKQGICKQELVNWLQIAKSTNILCYMV